MKILKQDTHSLFPHPVMLGGKQWLSAGVMIYFDLTNPDALLKEQDLWTEAPEQLGENPVHDQGWPKPRGEFLVAGAACAPGKERVHALKVSARVATVRKELLVIGDRFWVQSGIMGRKISPPIPYSEMPVTWERAFGGEGFALNPVGKGAVEVEAGEGLSIQPLPNIEHPGHLIISPSERPEPAGFGIVPPHYPQRSKLMGTCDQRWMKERWPGFPEDIDPAFFLAAPAGQQLPEYFTGEEKIEIGNMNHDMPLILSRLPRRRIRLFFMRRPGGKTKGYLPHEIEGGEYSEAKLSADTLWLFPNILRGVLIHRALVPCRDDEFSDIAWTHIVDEEPSSEPLPVEHYRDILLEKADFGQGAMAAKMLELQREMGKGALTVRNLPKSLREMKEESAGPPPEPTSFHQRWFPVLAEARSALLESDEAMQLLTGLGIETGCITRARLGWIDGTKATGGDGTMLGLPRGLVIPRFSGSLLTGLTIRPEPLADATLAVDVQGSSGTFAMLEAAIPGGPLVVATDELSALLLETEAGDFADIAVMPRPSSPLPDAAKQRLAAGAPVVLLLAAPPDERRIADWEKALPGARIATFGEAATLFEASQRGIDLREEILHLLPLEMARQHRLIIPGIAGKNTPGTPIAEALSAEAVKAAVEQAFPKSENPATSAPPPEAAGAGSPPAPPEPTGEINAAFAKQGIGLKLADVTKENLRKRLAAGKSFAMASFTNLDLNGIDFSGIDLTAATFDACSMQGCHFERAGLESASFSTCDLSGADLSGATLARTIFSGCRLAGARCLSTPLLMASFTESDLTGADFSDSTLNMVSFRNAIMKRVRFDRSRIELSTFAESELSETRFDATFFLKSMMEKCVLDRAVFSTVGTDALLLHGCAGKETRFAQSKLFKLRIGEACELPGVVFSGCTIERGYFRGANLAKASFPLSTFKNSMMDDCNLSQADFDMAPMTGCDLLKCNLTEANLAGCNLFAGSLRKSNLVRTDLGGANLYGVDFRKCVMGNTNMENANLRRSLLDGLEAELKKGGRIL